MTDLRTYIPGFGSSGALIAAVVVAFFALGGIVAIKGLPESSRPASAGTVLVESDPRDDGSEARATAPPSAQRRNIDPGRTSGADQGGRGGDDDSGSTGGIPQPVDPAPSPSDPPGLTPPATQPPDPGPKPPSSPQPEPTPTPQPAPPKGPFGGLVEGADGAAGDVVGFQPGMVEGIVPITEPIDGAIGVITDPIPLPDAPVPTDADAGN